jgi:hypothetical protein
MRSTLDTLPEALKLEICNHMDIFSLVAFSEVRLVILITQ